MIQRTPITCDLVFQRLTAGPFHGNGDGEHEIELHLRCCSDCRKLADAMRPAIGLIHESLDEEAKTDLPAYLSENIPSSDVMLAVRMELKKQPKEIEKSNVPSTPVIQTYGIQWIVAATLLLGFIAVSGLWLVNSPGDLSANHSVSPRILKAIQAGEFGEKQLVQFAVSTTCVPAEEVTQAILLQSDADQLSFLELKSLCCTKCHGSEKTTLTTHNDIAIVAAACTQCHGIPR